MRNSTYTKQTAEQLPNFYDLLSEQDKIEYLKLKSSLEIESIKRNRGHRIEAFGAILDEIRQYIEKRDENDWKRSLVCGVCWMDNMIAINTRQLRFLVTKCKSSINGSLQRLGYLTNPSHAESWKMFISKIPFLKDNYNELRQWTIRCKNEPFKPTPIVPYEISFSPFQQVNPYFASYCIQPNYNPNIVAPVYPNNIIILGQPLVSPNQIPYSKNGS